MKILSCTIFLVSLFLLKVQRTNYDEIFASHKPDLKNDTVKNAVAKYLSTDADLIKPNDFREVELKSNFNLIGYGFVDLIVVKLISQPTVIKPIFVIVVNHKKKQLYNVNVDHYYLIGGKGIAGFRLAAINNFRGNLEFSIFSLSKAKITPSFTLSLSKNDDCISYKYDTVSLNNKDLNKDGKSDIIINFTEIVTCDQNEIELSVPKEKNTIKKLIYNNKAIGQEKWVVMR